MIIHVMQWLVKNNLYKVILFGLVNSSPPVYYRSLLAIAI